MSACLNQEKKDAKIDRILVILSSFLSWFKDNPAFLSWFKTKFPFKTNGSEKYSNV